MTKLCFYLRDYQESGRKNVELMNYRWVFAVQENFWYYTQVHPNILNVGQDLCIVKSYSIYLPSIQLKLSLGGL